MAHALGVRATSVVVSSALLGVATIAAFTMTLVQPIDLDGLFDPPIVTIENPPPAEEPPQQQRAEEDLPPLNPISDFEFDPYVPDLPAVPTATFLPIGPSSSAGPPTVLDPEWVRVPRDLGRYYPQRALERGVEGSVTLDCLVNTIGALSCQVVSENPAAWGFGQAALRISRDYQMVPATRDGIAVAARHRMVMPFRLQ